VSGTMVVLYARDSERRLGVGVTTAKRFGGAVLRNRAKRRLREALKRLAGRVRDRGELVLVARSPILTAKFDYLVSELERLCGAAGLLDEREPREAVD
jgi:ribonuclease P protein component